jgi:YD repeat-containing protein
MVSDDNRIDVAVSDDPIQPVGVAGRVGTPAGMTSLQPILFVTSRMVNRFSMRTTIRFISAMLLLALGERGACAYAQQLCYGYDETGQLIAVVNQQGQTIIYDYDAVGNMVDIRRNDAAGPVAITFVSPTTAAGGAQIQLLGIGFSSDPSQNDVTIGGVSATVLSANSCSLTAIVPPEALAGPGSIQVTTPAGSATYAGSVTVGLGLIVSPSPVDAALNQSIGFFATVTGTTDQRVTWSVNGVAGGDSTNGTITAAGLYTAPAAVPPGVNVTVQAASVGLPSVTGQATVTIVTAANVYASTAVSVMFGAPPPESVLAPPTSVQFGPLPPGGANAAPVSVQFDAAPPSLSVAASPVSVQFGPLSPGGADAAPVSVAFGPLPGGVVHAAPVSVANAAVIDSIAPSAAALGANVGVHLAGTNFTGATALAFLFNGAPDSQLSATNIVVSPDGTQLAGSVMVGASAALGTHVVVVQTSGGISALRSTGNNIFTVTAH